MSVDYYGGSGGGWGGRGRVYILSVEDGMVWIDRWVEKSRVKCYHPALVKRVMNLVPEHYANL